MQNLGPGREKMYGIPGIAKPSMHDVTNEVEVLAEASRTFKTLASEVFRTFVNRRKKVRRMDLLI